MAALAKVRSECRGPLEGKHIRLQRLNAEEDYQELWEHSSGTPEKDAIWKYLNVETHPQPFKDIEAFRTYINDFSKDPSWIQFVVIDKKSNRKIGQINYLNVVPFHQRAEIGGLWYTPEFHGTYASNESTLLMLNYIFENLKYRRAEWKCNAENIPSGKAAAKLGFTEEGVFRQHMFTNGVNRNTKWFSMLDCEWEEKKQALFKRLCYTKEDEENFPQLNKN